MHLLRLLALYPLLGALAMPGLLTGDDDANDDAKGAELDEMNDNPSCPWVSNAQELYADYQEHDMRRSLHLGNLDGDDDDDENENENENALLESRGRDSYRSGGRHRDSGRYRDSGRRRPAEQVVVRDRGSRCRVNGRELERTYDKARHRSVRKSDADRFLDQLDRLFDATGDVIIEVIKGLHKDLRDFAKLVTRVDKAKFIQIVMGLAELTGRAGNPKLQYLGLVYQGLSVIAKF